MKKNYCVLLLLLVLSPMLKAAELSWKDLMKVEVPKDPKTSPKITKDLEEKTKNEVVIKGFMLPLDYDAKTLKEFLLVPYIPSCMHVPPPPPNQIIYITVEKGKSVEPSFYPVEVKGKLKLTKKSFDFTEAFFSMESQNIKEIKQ